MLVTETGNTTPDRNLDYSAVFENYDGAPDSNHPIGFGSTQLEAINNLIKLRDEKND